MEQYINGNSWYIVEIFLLYLSFYFIFKEIKNQDIAIILLCIAVGVIIYIGYISGHSDSELGDSWFKGEWWYNSTVTFAFAVIVARFKDRIEYCVKKHYKSMLAVTGILLVVFFEIEEYEKKMIVDNNGVGEKVSLLSVSQAIEFFDDDVSRQLEITDAAIKQGTNVNTLSKAYYWDTKNYRSSWWWLKGEASDITAPIVTAEGTVAVDEKYVNKPNGAVRPVIWVKIKD